VLPGERVALRAWMRGGPGANDARRTYTWAVEAGRLSGSGPEVIWDFTDVPHRPEPYTAEVRGGHESATTCALRVLVRRMPVEGLRGRETGWSFLVGGAQETPGYGLYSYLLLGAPPIGGVVRARYLKAIEAYVELVPHVARLEAYVPAAQLNVAYLPLTAAPPAGQAVTAAWVLQHYDYARARVLLGRVPGDFRDGPYILSSLRLFAAGERPQGLLFHDLSAVTPDLAAAWMKLFLNQAAQERFWEPRTAQTVNLKIRLTLAVAAEAVPEVQRSLDAWIKWIR
jgi:hypothetical protein